MRAHRPASEGFRALDAQALAAQWPGASAMPWLGASLAAHLIAGRLSGLASRERHLLASILLACLTVGAKLGACPCDWRSGQTHRERSVCACRARFLALHPMVSGGYAAWLAGSATCTPACCWPAWRCVHSSGSLRLLLALWTNTLQALSVRTPCMLC